MKKVQKRPGTALFPVPVVLVTSADDQGRANIITIAWAGTVCSEPPLLSISVRPSRHSHGLIKASGEFVVNVPGADLLKATDYCGFVSGRDVDKFAATGLTAVPASIVKAPLIGECPLNLECVVRQTLELGAHDMFIAEIVAVHQNQSALSEKGRLDVRLVKPFAYNGAGEYWGIGEVAAAFGFAKKAF